MAIDDIPPAAVIELHSRALFSLNRVLRRPVDPWLSITIIASAREKAPSCDARPALSNGWSTRQSSCSYAPGSASRHPHTRPLPMMAYPKGGCMRLMRLGPEGTEEDEEQVSGLAAAIILEPARGARAGDCARYD